MAKSIGYIWFVCCIEAVRILESPLWEVPLYVAFSVTAIVYNSTCYTNIELDVGCIILYVHSTLFECIHQFHMLTQHEYYSLTNEMSVA